MHTSLYALTTALVLAAIAPLAMAAASEDESAIRQQCDNFVAAWNKHDAKAMAATWAEDGDLINPFARAAKGRAEIEKLFTEEHSGVMRSSTYTAMEVTVRPLAPNVAISEWSSEITGMRDPGGAAIPAFKHHVVVIHEKRGGRWQAVIARAYAFATPPS